MFSKVSLKTKLLFAFALVSVFVVLVSAVGYHFMNKVQSEYGYISDVILSKVQKTSEINDTGHEAHRLIFRAYMTYVDKNPSEVSRIEQKFNEQKELMKKLDTEYRALPFMPGGKEYYENIWKSWQDYTIKAGEFFKLIHLSLENKATIEQVKSFIDNDLRESRLVTSKYFEELFTFQNKFASVKKSQAHDAHEAANFWSLLLSISGLVCAGTVGLYVAMTISKTISGISENILSSSTQTASASQQLTSASSQLSQGATESAASLEETVASLEELSSMVKLNSDHAKEASSLSQRSLHSAEKGEQDITKLITAMGDMSKSSKKIEEIINVIDDIAFQTNLLALNAAVEAARAGEQGKGFAVVADAVRNLAGRSAVAAKDINNLIKENVEKTVEGVHIADTSGASLKEILTSVKKVADLNSEISAASQEQASGIEQISKAMNHLDSAIQSNAASSEEVASSAAEMSSQAECLSSLVTDMQKFIEGAGAKVAEAPKAKTPTPQLKVVASNTPTRRSNAAEIFPMDEAEASKIGKAEGF